MFVHTNDPVESLFNTGVFDKVENQLALKYLPSTPVQEANPLHPLYCTSLGTNGSITELFVIGFALPHPTCPVFR